MGGEKFGGVQFRSLSWQVEARKHGGKKEDKNKSFLLYCSSLLQCLSIVVITRVCRLGRWKKPPKESKPGPPCREMRTEVSRVGWWWWWWARVFLGDGRRREFR